MEANTQCLLRSLGLRRKSRAFGGSGTPAWVGVARESKKLAWVGLGGPLPAENMTQLLWFGTARPGPVMKSLAGEVGGLQKAAAGEQAALPAVSAVTRNWRSARTASATLRNPPVFMDGVTQGCFPSS